MTKLTNLLILALALTILCGCSDFGLNTNVDTSGSKMVAEIIAISDKIEVNVIEGEYGASGIYWVNVSSTTLLETEDGACIKLSDLSVGDRVEIKYSGQVMMSYPPQIAAIKITKLA
jgi:hypothetical protein